MENKVEKFLEEGLFAARWLAVPIYIGLIFCLVILLVILAKYTVLVASHLPTINVHEAVVAVLSFIDLALIANLILIVLYSGYQNFVSRLSIEEHADRPAWLDKVDFTGLKLKLFSSIIAITSIELLKAFMDLREAGAPDASALMWLLIIHGVLIVTAFASAWSQVFGAASDHGS